MGIRGMTGTEAAWESGRRGALQLGGTRVERETKAQPTVSCVAWSPTQAAFQEDLLCAGFKEKETRRGQGSKEQEGKKTCSTPQVWKRGDAGPCIVDPPGIYLYI